MGLACGTDDITEAENATVELGTSVGTGVKLGETLLLVTMTKE